jgi:hypothetical protein
MKMLIDPLELIKPTAAFNGGAFVHPGLSVMRRSVVPAIHCAAVMGERRTRRYECVGSGNAAELATYIVEKGKPLLTFVK